MLGFDAVVVSDLLRHDAPDAAVVELAIREQRVVVTFDEGFGQRYREFEPPRFGVVVPRLSNQVPSSVDARLARLFADPLYQTARFDRSLVIVENVRIRVRSEFRGE